MVFAKWVLSAAFVFGGQVQDFPPLKQTAGTPAVRQVLEVYETREGPPCLPTANPDACTPAPFVIRARPIFCAAPGVYTVTVRLGLLAPWGAVSGRIWLEGAGEESLVAAWSAAPGLPAYAGGSLQVASAGDLCYRIRVQSNGPAEAIGDPSVSFVTFGG